MVAPATTSLLYPVKEVEKDGETYPYEWRRATFDMNGNLIGLGPPLTIEETLNEESAKAYRMILSFNEVKIPGEEN